MRAIMIRSSSNSSCGQVGLFFAPRRYRYGTVTLRPFLLTMAVLVLGPLLLAWLPLRSTGRDDYLTVYSGRSEDLIQPLIDRFTEETGIRVRIRYGQTAEMAATIMEEGRNSPADVILAQDAGALGVLARAGVLQPLPNDIPPLMDQRFRSPDGYWVGLSGRARVLVYHTGRVDPSQLPASWDDLADPMWRGRIGWAPQNGSFQAFVTALRVVRGEEAARNWLIAVHDNEARSYSKNTPILLAVAAGEIDLGLVNHYYLHALHRQMPDLPLANHYVDEGTLINTAGVGILRTTARRDTAAQFIRFLLSVPAQRYFAEQTFEYPMIQDVAVHSELPSLELLRTPDLNLTDLDDLSGTLRLLQTSGLL